MYDEIMVGFDIELGISRMFLNRIFTTLNEEFTFDEFSKSFMRHFKRRATEAALFEALDTAINSGLVSEISEDRFIYNGSWEDSIDLS